MRFREVYIRIVLFAISLLALVWGFQELLTRHAPDIFRDVNEDMSYGWYIPIFSLFILWRERGKIAASVGASSLWGLVILLPAAFVGFLGIRGIQVRLEIVGLIGLLIGLVWFFFGWRTMKCTLFPFLFLLFCLPLHTYLDLVTIHLRMLAVTIAYEVLSGCGVDVVREGTMLASSTRSFAIDVATPCSGLRSLFAMMALTAGYAYFTLPTWTRRGALFVLSIPIAVLGNVCRVVSIVLVASVCSSEFAMGFYHDYSGYVVFLVAVLLMVTVGGALTIRKGGEKCATS